MTNQENPAFDPLPLREPTFLILLSLAAAEKHGYAILKDVEALSDGRVRLSTGTLYGALERLLDRGLIRRMANQHAGGRGRPRKAYRLTDAGRRLLAAEAKRMQALGALAHLRLSEGDT